MEKKKDFYNKIKKIKLLAMDFDGVFTDNCVFTDEDGREFVCTNKFDSLGIKMLRELRKDIHMVVITKEQSVVTRARCAKLKLECYSGIDNKLEKLQEIINELGITMSDVAYVGNDIIDVECIKMAGIGIAVADSIYEVLNVADHETFNCGGKGAIREIIDCILN